MQLFQWISLSYLLSLFLPYFCCCCCVHNSGQICKGTLERHKTWTKLILQLSGVLILKNEGNGHSACSCNQTKLCLQAQYCNINFNTMGCLMLLVGGGGRKEFVIFLKTLLEIIIFVQYYRCSIAKASCSQNALDWKHTLKLSWGSLAFLSDIPQFEDSNVLNHNLSSYIHFKP